MRMELLSEFNTQLNLLGKTYFGCDELGPGILQFNYKHVQIITYTDRAGLHKIGTKRNKLKKLVTAKYMAYFDDDDLPAGCYFEELFLAIKSNKDVDCCSLRGMMTTDGVTPELFEHSIKYKRYYTNPDGPVKYERYPNHLNLIKTSIAQKFNFPPIDRGEDTDFATQIFKSGLIKTEAYIPTTLYYYRYKHRK